MFDDVSAATSSKVAGRLFGFDSTGVVVAMLLVFIYGMLLLLLVSAAVSLRRDARVPTLKLRGVPPELTLEAGQ
eukprot:6757721-Prymnesium_polylepis.1